jgi:hypothetical protein
MMLDDPPFPADDDWNGQDLQVLVDAAADGDETAFLAVIDITRDLASLVDLYRGVATRLRNEGADVGHSAFRIGRGQDFDRSVSVR